MAFADFLDVMHTHSSKENLPKELLDAFRSWDPNRRGVIPARDLWHILVKWGEQLSPREGSLLSTDQCFFTVVNILISVTVDQIFREASISKNGMVRYEEFVKIVCAPVPDYY